MSSVSAISDTTAHVLRGEPNWKNVEEFGVDASKIMLEEISSHEGWETISRDDERRRT